MKSRALPLALMLACVSVPCFSGAVRVTADLAADFLDGTSTQEIISTFSVGDQPLLWGIGWEVILDRIGFGGNYDVCFFQETDMGWWLDWLAPGLFLSCHFLGANRWLDPFIQVGAGCAGRVSLGDAEAGTTENLYLSLFPFAAAGLSLNLDGLLLAVKASYTPYNGQIPMTGYPTYPLGKFQVALSAGLSAGW